MTVAAGSGPDRGVRGGSWWYGAWDARAAVRSAFDPSCRRVILGLRLMRRCT